MYRYILPRLQEVIYNTYAGNCVRYSFVYIARVNSSYTRLSSTRDESSSMRWQILFLFQSYVQVHSLRRVVLFYVHLIMIYPRPYRLQTWRLRLIRKKWSGFVKDIVFHISELDRRAMSHHGCRQIHRIQMYTDVNQLLCGAFASVVCGLI